MSEYFTKSVTIVCGECGKKLTFAPEDYEKYRYKILTPHIMRIYCCEKCYKKGMIKEKLGKL